MYAKRKRLSFIFLTLVLALGLASQAAAEDEPLGRVDFPTSCAAALQEELARGVALLHHMMYVESRQTFQAVAGQEPGCAMAHWGVAMTLFQPLWPTRPGPEALAEGSEAAQRAQAIEAVTDREQGLIAAAAAFFQAPEKPDYWARIHRFEKAMSRVYRDYPEDIEVAAFYALARLATAPEATDRLGQHAEAAKILLGIYEKEPTHPGAIHYTIHANDIEGRQAESLDVVRSYGAIAPSVPHALHMPTHIFVRLGSWKDVIQWNRWSAEAALDYPAGKATSHHYPHALDYLIYAYLQRAEDDEAKAVLAAARSVDSYQKTFISAFHLASIPARYFVERKAWAEAAALPKRVPASLPWEKFPWPESITAFARGLGAARNAELAGAREALEELGALKKSAERAGEDYFATQIEIGHLAVAAWLAHGEGSNGEAVRLMRSSAELETATEKHPVTPGALLPASELLGDLLFELGQNASALEAYEASLKLWPGRFNTLLGAARAAAADGNREGAVSYYAKLLELAGNGNEERPGLREARDYTSAAKATDAMQ